MSKSKKYIRNLAGGLFLAIFFSVNIVAYNHAEKFTRFSTDKSGPRTRLDELTTWQKAKVIFTGISNPKPMNDSVPRIDHTTLVLGNERKLHTWFSEADSARGTVIIFHGYSAEKSQFIPHAEIIHEAGWNTLLVDFYGSGSSEGNESTIGYKEAADVKTAFDYIAENKPGKIILMGTSMGAASVMKATSEKLVDPDGLILECPFGNMRSAVNIRVKNMGAPTFPFTDLFMLWGGALNGFWTYSHNPEKYARQIEVPTLLLYGEKDNKVPRTETDIIFNNLKGEKKLVTFPESGHESYLKLYKKEWTESVTSFLNE